MRPVQCIVAITLAVACLAGCSRASQIGTDEATFGEVDALYTAVTSKRTDLLDASWERMETLHRDGRVPNAAFDELQTIVDRARQNEWEPAAERLWTFMRQQRR